MGIDAQRLDQLRDRVRREVDDGRLPSCQIAVGLDGEVVVHESFGDATPDTRYVIFSATKGFIAGVMYQLIDEGSVTASTPVAEYFPQFAENGKAGVTVEQVLTHTSGFPRAPMSPDRWHDRAQRCSCPQRIAVRT